MNPHTARRGFVTNGTLIGLVVLIVIILIVFFSFFKMQTIEGNQAAVKETWSGGVDPSPYPSRTYWLHRWTETLYPYDIAGQVFVMNDKTTQEEPLAEGRRFDALEIVSADNQKVIFYITLQWHRDQLKLVPMHKQFRDSVEERLIRPKVVEAVRARSTVLSAIELYSGKSLEDTRVQIEKDLRNPDGALATNGVIVDSFIIDRTRLPDEEYVKKIEARQRAIIGESAAKAQEKQNLAEADAAKAAALKKQFEDVVVAETSKKTAILKQEGESEQAIIKVKADAENAIVTQKAESEKVVLAAKAEADRQVAISESAKKAELNRAVAILEVGKAEAEAQKLKLTAFSTPGSDLYTRIEVAKSYAAALNMVRFYPSNATFSTIAKDLDSGLSILANPSK